MITYTITVFMIIDKFIIGWVGMCRAKRSCFIFHTFKQSTSMCIHLCRTQNHNLPCHRVMSSSNKSCR